MPFLPDFPDHYRVVCKGNVEAQPWVNVFYVESTTGGETDTDLDTFASDFANAYDGHLLEHVTDESTLTDVIVTDLTDAFSPQGSWNGAHDGDLAVATLPLQVSVCLSWKVHFRYRGGHPRTYLASIPEAARANQRKLSDAYIANYLSDATGFLAAVNALTIGANSVALGTVSYYSKPENPTPPHLRGTPLFLAYVGAAVHGRLDTQRRRLGRET